VRVVEGEAALGHCHDPVGDRRAAGRRPPRRSRPRTGGLTRPGRRLHADPDLGRSASPTKLAAVTFKEYALQDGNTLEATQRSLKSRVATSAAARAGSSPSAGWTGPPRLSPGWPGSRGSRRPAGPGPRPGT